MLINIKPLPNKEAETIANSLELPLIVRIPGVKSKNRKPPKTSYILGSGSHHGYGLETLFAREIEKYCSDKLSSVVFLDTIKNSNLRILANDPGNIAAILERLPGKGDAASLIKIAFGDSCSIKPKGDAFSYFSKSNDKVELETITVSHILLAEIYKMLQAANRIDPTEKLAAKIEYIISGGESKKS